MTEVIYEPSAETAMLSCLCHAPANDQTEILTHVREEHFYLNENKLVFRAIQRAMLKGQQADWINVQNDLIATNELDVAGGQAKIAEIATFCPSHTTWKRYYPKLEEARYRRSLEFLASDMVHKARDREIKLEELKNWSETSVMKADYLLDDTDKLSIAGPLNRAIDNIESTIAGTPRIGVRTGLEPVDKYLMFGLRGGDMVVVAARPAQGKTSMSMQIVEHVAIEQKKRVLIFSLEMTSVALMERMVRSRARVRAADILARKIGNFERQSLARATGEIQSSAILCDDGSAKSIGYIKSVARRAHQKEPLDLIVIDYLQLVRGDTKRGKDNRVCEVEEISGGVKDLAKTLNVPVVVIAQLNRDPDKRQGRPSLADLKGSSAIEMDADIVMLLHMNEEGDDIHSQFPKMDVIVAKNREGETGIASMVFNKAITRFEPAFDSFSSNSRES